ncbi:MAG: hypothetical protein IKR04_04250 [Clostridia bacterium]|nr:hypothetical protein [Clostridia bacterium]
MKKVLIISLILIIIIIIFAIPLYILLADRYDAEDIANDYMKSTDAVKISEENEYFFFDGSREDVALIFYPGAKVEEKAYARLMNLIAQNGIDCYLVKLPFRLALFNANGADDIIKKNNYKQVYVGGHSLGGVIAGNYAYENMDKVDGLVLVESRADVKLDDDLKVLSIVTSNDGVLDWKAYENAKNYLPADYTEIIIEGGNHSGIANYGEQKGDGQATITKEEQQNKTAEAIVDFIIKEN